VTTARALLFAGLALALACDRPAPRSEIPARLAALGRPNLVLIVVDTLRADYLTPYGFDRDTSPELAAWAARGVLFERVRSQSSWTKMSMASLLTSLWPRSHGQTSRRCPILTTVTVQAASSIWYTTR
jgi:glucan phosphoethanolaminetransferase (alkaline phosphatase superfamily)